MKYSGLISLFLYFVLSSQAQNFIADPKAEHGLNSWFTKQVGLASDNKGKCFYIKRPEGCATCGGRVSAKEMVKVDSSKTYEISGSFKFIDSKGGRFFFGYLGFDKNKQRIPLKRPLCHRVYSSSKDKPPVQWTEYSGKTKLAKGTKYIVPYIYYLSKNYRKCKLYFKNIRVKEL